MHEARQELLRCSKCREEKPASEFNRDRARKRGYRYWCRACDYPPRKLSDKLCECGCGGRTLVAMHDHPERGWVKGEPLRFVAHHQGRLQTPDPLYVLEDRGHDTPCWIWQGAILVNGYGIWGQQVAHRRFYEDQREPVADGLELDHLCAVKACMNPDHLEPVTHLENMQRWAARRRTQAPSKDLRGQTTRVHKPRSVTTGGRE